MDREKCIFCKRKKSIFQTIFGAFITARVSSNRKSEKIICLEIFVEKIKTKQIVIIKSELAKRFLKKITHYLLSIEKCPKSQKMVKEGRYFD